MNLRLTPNFSRWSKQEVWTPLSKINCYAKINYGEEWKVLAVLFIDLRKGGEAIPENVMNDLRSAKTMIQILKADPTHIENLPRIETYLANVESYLVSAAEKRFGSEFAKRWMKKLEEAKGKIEEEARTVSRFVPGLPIGETWVRVQVSEDTPREDIERLAAENELLQKIENEYVLVYGDGKKIKTFVKKMAEKFRGSRKG